MCHVQAAQASHTLFTSSSLDSQIELSANHNPTNRELVHNFLTDLKKISASLSLTNNPPPKLIEFRVNWPFPRRNEVPWSVYVSTVFIISLLPSLTLEVFFFSFLFLQDAASRGRKEEVVGGGRRWEPIVCECNMETHSPPISHAFSSADICWHFVSSYLFEHL